MADAQTARLPLPGRRRRRDWWSTNSNPAPSRMPCLLYAQTGSGRRAKPSSRDLTTFAFGASRLEPLLWPDAAKNGWAQREQKPPAENPSPKASPALMTPRSTELGTAGSAPPHHRAFRASAGRWQPLQGVSAGLRRAAALETPQERHRRCAFPRISRWPPRQTGGRKADCLAGPLAVDGTVSGKKWIKLRKRVRPVTGPKIWPPPPTSQSVCPRASLTPIESLVRAAGWRPQPFPGGFAWREFWAPQRAGIQVPPAPAKKPYGRREWGRSQAMLAEAEAATAEQRPRGLRAWLYLHPRWRGPQS